MTKVSLAQQGKVQTIKLCWFSVWKIVSQASNFKNLPHWFLDILHVRSLHAVAAGAPWHAAAAAVRRVSEHDWRQKRVWIQSQSQSFKSDPDFILVQLCAISWWSHLLKYMSELIEALPWNLLKLASLVSWTLRDSFIRLPASPWKNWILLHTLAKHKIYLRLKIENFYLIRPSEIHVAADAFGVAKLLDGILTSGAWAAHSRGGALGPGGSTLFSWIAWASVASQLLNNTTTKDVRRETYLLSKLFSQEDVGFEALLATFSFKS